MLLVAVLLTQWLICLDSLKKNGREGALSALFCVFFSFFCYIGIFALSVLTGQFSLVSSYVPIITCQFLESYDFDQSR
jgi:hypothetical protein